MGRNMTDKDKWRVPTIEEIAEALRLPEVEQKLDNLGRVIRKKNPAKSVVKWSPDDPKNS